MNIDSEFAILSIMQFLTPYETLNYLSINKEVYYNYNNEKIWYKIFPNWSNIELTNLKKSLHFNELASKYTLPELMDEITNEQQLNIVKIYVRKYTCSDVTKKILSSMISKLTPTFLQKRKPLGLYCIHLHYLRCMKLYTMEYLLTNVFPQAHT